MTENRCGYVWTRSTRYEYKKQPCGHRKFHFAHTDDFPIKDCVIHPFTSKKHPCIEHHAFQEVQT